MRRKIPLPRGSNHRVKAGVIQILAAAGIFRSSRCDARPDPNDALGQQAVACARSSSPSPLDAASLLRGRA
jgi:hypothetical protein